MAQVGRPAGVRPRRRGDEHEPHHRIDYGSVDADLLCLWGAADGEQPVEDGRRLVDDVGGEIVAFDDAGHWVTEDRPAAYRDRLEEFLLR